MDKQTIDQFNDAYVLIAQLSEKIALQDHKIEVMTKLLAKILKRSEQ